jgi:hypothetical protein
MNTFLKLIFFLVAAFFISFVSSSIAESFDIEFALYGSYVFWILALCLLYIILPVKPISIFSQSLQKEIVGGSEQSLNIVVKTNNPPVPRERPPPPPSHAPKIVQTVPPKRFTNVVSRYNGNVIPI